MRKILLQSPCMDMTLYITNTLKCRGYDISSVDTPHDWLLEISKNAYDMFIIDCVNQNPYKNCYKSPVEPAQYKSVHDRFFSTPKIFVVKTDATLRETAWMSETGGYIIRLKGKFPAEQELVEKTEKYLV